MKLLALDTSANHCSVALSDDDRLWQHCELAPRRHTQLILPMVEALLSETGFALNQLDGLAFGAGPGSFTGLRIAAGIAQGLAFGADLPLAPISTLAALAQRGYAETGATRLLPAFDARMGEVYWGAYEVNENGLVVPCIPDGVVAPERVKCPEGEGWHGLGDGWDNYGEVLGQRLGEIVSARHAEFYCRAQDLLPLAHRDIERGLGVKAEKALPFYLRNEVAWKKVTG